MDSRSQLQILYAHLNGTVQPGRPVVDSDRGQASVDPLRQHPQQGSQSVGNTGSATAGGHVKTSTSSSGSNWEWRSGLVVTGFYLIDCNTPPAPIIQIANGATRTPRHLPESIHWIRAGLLSLMLHRLAEEVFIMIWNEFLVCWNWPIVIPLREAISLEFPLAYHTLLTGLHARLEIQTLLRVPIGRSTVLPTSSTFLRYDDPDQQRLRTRDHWIWKACSYIRHMSPRERAGLKRVELICATVTPTRAFANGPSSHDLSDTLFLLPHTCNIDICVVLEWHGNGTNCGFRNEIGQLVRDVRKMRLPNPIFVRASRQDGNHVTHCSERIDLHREEALKIAVGEMQTKVEEEFEEQTKNLENPKQINHKSCTCKGFARAFENMPQRYPLLTCEDAAQLRD